MMQPLPISISISSRFLRGLCVMVALIVPSMSHAQDINRKAPPQAEPVVVENATIHPIVGDVIDKGYVYFKDGLIVGVGAMPLPRFEGPVKIIDGTGKHVYPGLIAPYSQIGLTEVAAVRATLDIGEIGLGTPEARAAVAVNPDSAILPVTRSNGVLLAGVFPQTNSSGLLAYFSGPGGLVPGRASVMRLEGWTWEDMAISAEAGLVINWPFPRVVDAWWMNKTREEQQRALDRSLRALDDLFAAARAYTLGPAPEAQDIRFEAMKSIFRRPAANGAAAGASGAGQPGGGQRPVFIEAMDVDAIRQAVAFCDKFDLRCVIIGGRDAPMCADLLKRRNIPIIVLGTYSFPKRDDSAYDEAFTLPARLEALGLSWCLASSEEAPNERNLPYAAALAVAHGLDQKVALEAITLRAARILGVDRQYGSIEPGKSATLIMTSGNVLEITTNVVSAFIDGRQLDLADKHKALADKYREKYRQLNAALPAPGLGPNAAPATPTGANPANLPTSPSVPAPAPINPGANPGASPATNPPSSPSTSPGAKPAPNAGPGPSAPDRPTESPGKSPSQPQPPPR